MGRNPVFWIFNPSQVVQSAEIGRDFVLQHGTNQARMVEYLGDPWGALQSGPSSGRTHELMRPGLLP